MSVQVSYYSNDIQRPSVVKSDLIEQFQFEKAIEDFTSSVRIAGSYRLDAYGVYNRAISYMAIERPGAYILIGNGDSAPVHNPYYNFNDEAIPVGCSWWAEIIEKRMPLS